MVKSLPALHDVVGMAGVKLPEYLGKVMSEKGRTTPERVVRGTVD